ncbi:MAG: hypothetical protein WDO70_12445 [Alphaproteobacteria bacterium]
MAQNYSLDQITEIVKGPASRIVECAREMGAGFHKQVAWIAARDMCLATEFCSLVKSNAGLDEILAGRAEFSMKHLDTQLAGRMAALLKPPLEADPAPNEPKCVRSDVAGGLSNLMFGLG